jgi:hypothetical protein
MSTVTGKISNSTTARPAEYYKNKYVNTTTTTTKPLVPNKYVNTM